MAPLHHLFVFPHQTSLIRPLPPGRLRSQPLAPFLLPLCLLCTRPPFFYPHRPFPIVHPPSSIFTWRPHRPLVSPYLCQCGRCPIIDRSPGSFSPNPSLAVPLQLPQSRVWCWGRGMCPEAGGPLCDEQSKTHTYTTCISWGKETAILWCEDRWLPLLSFFSITWPHIWPEGAARCICVHICVREMHMCAQKVEVGSLWCCYLSY